MENNKETEEIKLLEPNEWFKIKYPYNIFKLTMYNLPHYPDMSYPYWSEKEIKEYAQYVYKEKLKISIPSEEEIKDKFPERSESGYMLDQNIGRIEGAKWIIKLLTKQA